MLTPKELLQTEFRVGLRGYQQKDVDNFVRKVVQSYEALTRRNKELTELLEQAELALNSLREEGDRSTEMLRLAQENAVDIKTKAEKQAQQILQDAEKRAEEIVSQAKKLEREALGRVERIREEEKAVRAAWRRLLEGALRLLDDSELNEDQDWQARSEAALPEVHEAAAASDSEEDVSADGDVNRTDELQGEL